MSDCSILNYTRSSETYLSYCAYVEDAILIEEVQKISTLVKSHKLSIQMLPAIALLKDRFQKIMGVDSEVVLLMQCILMPGEPPEWKAELYYLLSLLLGRNKGDFRSANFCHAVNKSWMKLQNPQIIHSYETQVIFKRLSEELKSENEPFAISLVTKMQKLLQGDLFADSLALTLIEDELLTDFIDPWEAEFDCCEGDEQECDALVKKYEKKHASLSAEAKTYLDTLWALSAFSQSDKQVDDGLSLRAAQLICEEIRQILALAHKNFPTLSQKYPRLIEMVQIRLARLEVTLATLDCFKVTAAIIEGCESFDKKTNLTTSLDLSSMTDVRLKLAAFKKEHPRLETLILSPEQVTMPIMREVRFLWPHIHVKVESLQLKHTFCAEFFLINHENGKSDVTREKIHGKYDPSGESDSDKLIDTDLAYFVRTRPCLKDLSLLIKDSYLFTEEAILAFNQIKNLTNVELTCDPIVFPQKLFEALLRHPTINDIRIEGSLRSKGTFKLNKDWNLDAYLTVFSGYFHVKRS